MAPIVLLVLAIAFVEGQLEFKSSQIGHNVTTNCTLKDLPSTHVTLLISMIIAKLDGGHEEILASVTSASSRPVNHTGVVTSSISMDGSHESFVSIVWSSANVSLEGDYVCRANGLDSDNQPASLSQTLSLKLQDTGPGVKATPDEIEVGMTKSLAVKCFFSDLARLNVAQLTSIDLSHVHGEIDQLLVTLNVFDGIQVKPGSQIVTSGGYLGQAEFTENYLEVSWPDPDANRTGKYECAFTGIQTTGAPWQFKSSFELRLVDPSKEVLTQRLQELRDKFDILSKENQEITAERDSLSHQKRILEESLEGHGICDDVDLPVGQYLISLFPDDGQGLLNVLCHVVSPGDVWTVFQKRYSGEVDFNRNFAAYDTGFGSVQGEHWLGLSKIKRIMKTGSYQLRVDITDYNDITYTRIYPTFGIGSSDGYQLTVDGYNDGGHGMSYMSGAEFSTLDHGPQQHCAIQDFAGWWYDNCAFSNLNGQWGQAGEAGVSWFELPDGRSHPLKSTEMKFKRSSTP
jgi:hypothetical protein